MEELNVPKLVAWEMPNNVFIMEKHIKMGSVFPMIVIHAHVKMEKFNVPKYFAWEMPNNAFTMEKHIKMGSVFLMIAIHARVKMEEFNVPKNFALEMIMLYLIGINVIILVTPI